MPAVDTVRTERLVLTAVTAHDVAALYELSSDPRVWQHFPSGRHVEPATTEAQVARFVAAWQRDGLGYWTARLHEGGTFVGVGGCMQKGSVAWNLYYRIRPEAQGHGYAGEIVEAAKVAAAQVRPDLPVVAYLVEHNVASRRTAERAGLDLVWRGRDYGNPDPDAIRLVYADRELSEQTLGELTEHV